MDIRFDYKGLPNGGCILNYLLEKARVISHSNNERNFHIFYQIINGAADNLLEEICLDKNIFQYNYLYNSKVISNEKDLHAKLIDEDKWNFKQLENAFEVCNFPPEDEKVI